MNYTDRANNYQRQNNGGALTPRQSRRLNHKLNHAVARAERSIPDEPPPFVSLCPTCNVSEGPCLTKSGKPTKNHKGREQ